eukprot:scaffold143060_cov39-Prasinocladus_malaysianus.AAC.2
MTDYAAAGGGGAESHYQQHRAHHGFVGAYKASAGIFLILAFASQLWSCVCHRQVNELQAELQTITNRLLSSPQPVPQPRSQATSHPSVKPPVTVQTPASDADQEALFAGMQLGEESGPASCSVHDAAAVDSPGMDLF